MVGRGKGGGVPMSYHDMPPKRSNVRMATPSPSLTVPTVVANKVTKTVPKDTTVESNSSNEIIPTLRDSSAISSDAVYITVPTHGH